MSFTTQSSTAIGWANFLLDYVGGYHNLGIPIDGALTSAIADAVNGTHGAVPGGTIYFPPLTGNNKYTITGLHTITGSCALVSTGPQDVTLFFQPTGGVTTGSAFIISGANVTMQGFTLDYVVTGVSPGSDNVAAIQVVNTSGVLLRNLDITNAFGGVDCIGSSMECEWMHIRKIQDPGVSPQMAFGFRAQPGSLTGSSLDGLVMKLRRCEPHLPATGAAGFILASPYPEMAVQDSPASNGEFGFYVQAPTGSPTGNLGILRIRNSTAENDTYGLYADGGSVVQSSALMSDECKTASIFLTSNFSGVASLAGDHYVSLGPNAVAGLAIGTTGSASSAMVRNLERMCMQADGLILSTHELATDYSRLNPRVFVCHNALDDVHFARHAAPAVDGSPKRPGQIRIGYASGDSHGGDIAMIAPALCRVLERYPQVRLVFFGANYRQFIAEALWDQTEYLGGTGSAPGLRYDDPRLDAATEQRMASVAWYDRLKRADFDIGVAPIEPVRFSSCKSYLKIIEYGMLGVPSLASRFGPYVQYQAEAREPVVALADGLTEWERSLAELVECKAWRAGLARANLEYVRRRHLMSKRVQAWEDALMACISERRCAVKG